MEAIAAYLLEHDKMTGEQFENVMLGRPADYVEPTEEVTEEAPAEPAAETAEPAEPTETEE